ncbi:MAG: M28 family peptidase [Bacteroidales bacterium]
MVLLHPIVLGFLFSLPVLLSGCSGQEQNHSRETPAAAEQVQVPVFNQDSAYAYVEKQVLFGPRVPNSEAHEACGDYLQQTLSRMADTVYVQQARVRAYDGTVLDIRNIIGSFQPGNPNRILLCGHWDSRPYADHDPNPANHYTPIDGANDGASSIGVLLEVARIIQQQQPQVGVDIIFFDAEDYGPHEQHSGYVEDAWALGSQYWARNPHRPDYVASYGILLDMVGYPNSVFKKEGYSMMYASNIVRKVWDAARQAGYAAYFPDTRGGHIIDDHYYVNTLRNIPTIDIIHQDDDTSHGFFPYWHTVNDTMEHIDANTLGAVGQTLLTVLYKNP